MLSSLPNVIYAALSSYIMACIIASSSLLSLFRSRVMARTPWLQVPGHNHFIECRLCLSFYTSIAAVLLFGLPLIGAIPVYGLAYFLATQER